MFDDIHAHFVENLVEAYIHYRDVRNSTISGNSDDLRAASVACVALYHFREHLDPVHSVPRRRIASLCPDFELIADIANASKHFALTRDKSQIQGATSLHETIAVTEYEDAEGTYTDARKLVYVTLNDGSQREVFEVATNVINFWGQELARLGVVESYKPFPAPQVPGSIFVLRSDARGLDLKMIRGVRFTRQFQLMRFNPSKGFAEPVDLTGSDVMFRIFQPPDGLDAP